ncbi:hypothetical protein NP493_720g01032 [Ridgeia piscesae]|uniref:Uncharacterized protein n=1 Tax=Ridgeia piscesae TaxID=27915 RepID=A0AAD9NQD9_RIDPI|nr:hypothetical protein NP493_720g01032 [Ridgeia piscesae]
MAFSLESEGPTKIPPVPSFNELIEQQIVEQKILHQRQLESERRNFEKRLSQISTPRVAERSAELKELRQKQAEEAEAEAERERMAGRERKTWVSAGSRGSSLEVVSSRCGAILTGMTGIVVITTVCCSSFGPLLFVLLSYFTGIEVRVLSYVIEGFYPTSKV